MEVQEGQKCGVHAVFDFSGTRNSFNPPMTRRYLVTEIQPNTTALRLSPVHTLYLAKGPGQPRKKILLLNVIFYAKRRTPLTHSTLLESSRRETCANPGTQEY